MTMKDKEVWEQYTRGVKLARKKPLKETHIKADPEKGPARKAAEKAPIKVPVHREGTGSLKNHVSKLERSREKSLKQGDIEIDAKLDLHGFTQSEAYEALAHFMDKKTRGGKRHLLIVTGKGRGGEGVLRRSLETWLYALPQAKQILALRPAAICHGGDGAFYVILRKK